MLKGAKMSEAQKTKISMAHLGKKHNDETRKKLSDITKRKKWIGEKNPMWKGDKVGYVGLHVWMKKTYGKASKCDNKKCTYPKKNSCGKITEKPKRFEWSNISKEYKRDRNDWMMLCPSCHRKYDAGCLDV